LYFNELDSVGRILNCPVLRLSLSLEFDSQEFTIYQHNSFHSLAIIPRYVGNHNEIHCQINSEVCFPHIGMS